MTYYILRTRSGEILYHGLFVTEENFCQYLYRYIGDQPLDEFEVTIITAETRGRLDVKYKRIEALPRYKLTQ